jgi:hypothetical protein
VEKVAISLPFDAYNEGLEQSIRFGTFYSSAELGGFSNE